MIDLLRKASEKYLQNYFNKVEAIDVPISYTKSDIVGDFTITLFPLVKQFKQNPVELGQVLKDKLLASDLPISDISITGGFLNITLSDVYWIEKLQSLNPTKIDEKSSEQKVIVEFSSPNTNKPLHLGHVRNFLIGESMSSIFQFLGDQTKKVQVINDRGIAICKSMLMYSKYEQGNTPESAGIKGDHFIGNLYVRFEKEFSEEYAAWQLTDLAKEVYESMKTDQHTKEQFFKSYKNNYFNAYSALGKEARLTLQAWEAGDPDVLSLWNTLNQWVYQGFNQTYEAYGIHFDQNYYESETYLLGKKMIQYGLDHDFFQKDDDGSVWVDLTTKGMDRKILLRSDGTSVYITQDLGLAKERYDENKFDQMIYVVADEQNYHFQVLFAALEMIGEPYAGHLHHLSYGMVELPSGRMKSREGNVVDADDLLNEVTNVVRSNSADRPELASLDDDEKAKIYHHVALGAIKYHMLKVNARKKMVFNPEESVDMHGQTGPYIQNAFVRIQSIFRKANLDHLEPISIENILEEERALILILSRFKEVVEESRNSLDPSLVANYVYDLAKAFHKYYHDTPILNAEHGIKNFRLVLIAQIAEHIKVGLNLLGIDVIDRM